MTYKIIFSDSAEKKLAKIDKSVKKRIINFLEKRVQPNPHLLKQSLQGTLKTLWKYRVGDYRIICQIKDKELIILIIDVGHRSKIYKND